MDKVNILEELSKPGYNIAFFTSYSIDIAFFEKMILHKLLDQGCSYISLFIDQNCLEEALEQEKFADDLGRLYVVNGVRCTSAFHPKVFFLLGEKKAKLIVGSGNITPSGLITNNELFSVFEYSEQDSTNLPLIQKAYRTFRTINGLQNTSSMMNIFNRAEEFHYLKVDTTPIDILFIDNWMQPIYEQILPVLPEQIESIDIMVPYFDRNLDVIERLNKDLKPKEISIYLQNKTSNFPIKKPIPQNCKRFEFQINELNRRYHGKTFRFVGTEKEVIIYGSANCSVQALLKTFEKGGNSEVIILETGVKGEFDSLFTHDIVVQPLSSNFEVIDEEMEYKSSTINLYFIEAILVNNKLTMHLETNEIIDEVLINGVSGELKTSVDRLTATWDGSISNLPVIFDFKVRIKEQQVILTGWYHNADVLLRTQLKENQLPYFVLKDDPEIRNYQNMVGLLDDFLKRLTLTEEELNNKLSTKKSAAIINELSEENAGIATNNNVEDYYVNESEMYNVYGAERGYDVLGELIKQLLRPFYEDRSSENKDNNTTISLPHEVEHILEKSQLNQVIDRMRKFINKFNKGITSETYIEKVSDEILINNIVIYSEFLWKVYEKQQDEELLTKDLILNQYILMTNAICKFAKKNVIKNSLLDEYVIPLCLSAVFVKDQILDNGEDLAEVRVGRKELENMLKNIHGYLKPIRTQYINYHSMASKHIERFGTIPTIDEFQKRLEPRFPFVMLGVFQQYLGSRFQNNLQVTPTQDKPIIKITFDIQKHQVDLNIRQLDILKKMLTVEEWVENDEFEISWVNIDTKAPMKTYTLKYNKSDKVLIKRYEYRKGKSERIEVKRRVDKSHIIYAAEINDFEFLVEGFK